MSKLNFAQAKARFKTDEETLSYFILVENYKKHLKAEQKEAFLNATTIESMINILDIKQLKHLKNLISTHAVAKRSGHIRLNSGLASNYGGEGLSEWFVENTIKKVPDYYNVSDIACNKLFSTIKDIEKQKLETEGYEKKIFQKYKSNLKKFDGNSVEYRQWLILFVSDHGIPNIEKIYDINKLLKQLSIEYLKKLEGSIGEFKSHVEFFIQDIKVIEPYLYKLATSGSKENLEDYSNGSIGYIERSNSEYKAFEVAVNNLITKIGKLIKEKEELVNDKIENLKKSGLKNPTMFYEDIKDILHNIGGDNEVYLKDVISEYSKPFAMGEVFNTYLRFVRFLTALNKGEISSSDLTSFRNKILKVREYFIKHLTSKKYTVYRGMGFDGLVPLLLNANPLHLRNKEEFLSLLANKDKLIAEINQKKPIIFDEGLVSTSLNKGIAAHEFGGKKHGNVFFKIQIPAGSKALVLDYENILNVPREEEVLLAPRTKIKINSIQEVNGHFEIEAEVVK